MLVQAQPHLPSGAIQAGDTTTAARTEAQQTTPEASKQVHDTAEHTKGVAEHAASSAHVCFPLPCIEYIKFNCQHQARGPGATGNAFDAVTQLRAKVEQTTDAAVAEGQKNVQAATDAGSRYIEGAKNLASSAISTAAVCLSIFSRRSSTFLL